MKSLKLPSSDRVAYDELFFRMRNAARAVATPDVARVALALFPLKYVLEAEIDADSDDPHLSQNAGRAWHELQTSPNIYSSLHRIAQAIDQQFDHPDGIFDYILLRDIERVPESTVRAWINELAALPLWNPSSTASFVDWLDAKLDEGALGLRARELNTPKSISRLMVSLANISDGDRVLDPFAGIGALLAEVAKQSLGVDRNVSLHGQERDRMACAWATLRLVLLGRGDAEVVCANSLESPALTEANELAQFDVVLCDGPFGTMPQQYQAHFSDTLGRFPLLQVRGLSTDAAVIQNVAASLDVRGRAVVLLPHGFLFRKGPDQRVRQWLVDANLVQAVIGLPAKLLPHTSIETALVLLESGLEPRPEIVFVDASDVASTIRGQVELNGEAIDQIYQAVFGLNPSSDESVAVRRVARDDVRQQDCSFQPRRYVNHGKLRAAVNSQALRTAVEGAEARYREARDEMDGILERLMR